MQPAIAGAPICVWDAQAILGEGPVWDARANALYWTDIKGYRLHRFHPSNGAKKTWRTTARVSAFAPRANGGFVCAADAMFAFLELPEQSEDALLTPIFSPEPELPGNRFNDGKCDAQGNFWTGTMDDAEERETGSWWRLSANGAAKATTSRYKVTNGPVFSPDGRRVWLTDSAKQEIRAGDLDANGQIQNVHLFRRFNEQQGYPDGMTLDSEGCLWIAFWDGACVRRLDPSAETIEEVALPVPRPTSVAIGGADGRTLFVTSAQIGLPEENKGLSGGLFTLTLTRPLALETALFAG